MAVIVGALARVVAAVLIEKNLCRGGRERKREHVRDNEYRRWRESLHRFEFRTMFGETR